ncbi:MAG: hypothetical protein O3B74_05760, partial [Proteobacteria bacterium]|nr:hypothetical protein [Pseudomonadota bacterium]
ITEPSGMATGPSGNCRPSAMVRELVMTGLPKDDELFEARMAGRGGRGQRFQRNRRVDGSSIR